MCRKEGNLVLDEEKDARISLQIYALLRIEFSAFRSREINLRALFDSFSYIEVMCVVATQITNCFTSSTHVSFCMPFESLNWWKESNFPSYFVYIFSHRISLIFQFNMVVA